MHELKFKAGSHENKGIIKLNIKYINTHTAPYGLRSFDTGVNQNQCNEMVYIFLYLQSIH